MSNTQLGLESLGAEFSSAKLADKRLSKRVEKLGKSLGETPEASFPTMFCEQAELEGAYRFFRNERVRWSDILSPHRDKTFERASAQKTVVVAHDTTTFKFLNHSEREGLGRISSNQKWTQGFFGHFSLVVDHKERIPLGLAEAKFFTRNPKPKERKRDRKKPKGPQDESYRWIEQVQKVEKAYDGPAHLVHAMDAECDSYELFDELKEFGIVVRLHYDRCLEGEIDKKLFESLDKAEVRFKREVKLSKRRKGRHPNERAVHPPRSTRMAKLNVASKAITIKKSGDLNKKYSDSLTLNIVHVWEDKPPKGAEPIDWKLATTEPIDTVEQVKEIVDYYRARWVIEEYFKAIKTGCAFQQRQQESLHALLNVLAVFIPIAWWLIAICKYGREQKNKSSSIYISKLQKRMLAKRFPKLASSLSTISGVMYAIAKLGGHIKYNGPPGWQTIFRGYEKLLLMEFGYRTLADLDPVQHV